MKTINSSFVFATTWLIFITVLLTIPGTRLPKVKWDDKIWLDKWIHLLLFLVLVFLWCKAYSRSYKLKLKKIFTGITLLAVVYGVAMELIQQYFVPFRSFAYADMIANTMGCLAGYLISLKRFRGHS